MLGLDERWKRGNEVANQERVRKGVAGPRLRLGPRPTPFPLSFTVAAVKIQTEEAVSSGVPPFNDKG